MKFIDKTEITIKAGDGGNGICTFKTARNMPKLGPDGGNGGRGGDVFFCADLGNNTLSTLRYKRMYQAEDGGKGAANNKTGKTGKHLKIPVPLGTIIYNKETGKKIAEITEPTDEIKVLEGGNRGYGNLSFATSTRQAPRMFTKGKEGETLDVICELKLLADVGLAGFPNAGKSTLLSVISSAKPKIADYPFTTLTPNLGVVDLGDPTSEKSSFVIADVPGLIEGASEGKGLGHEFLQHLERCKVIVYLLDSSSMCENTDLLLQWQKLNHELASYSEDLVRKPFLVVFSKVDSLHDKDHLKETRKHFENLKIKTLEISSLSKIGLKDLIFTLAGELEDKKDDLPFE
jgi:GTP-binding protein